MRYLDFRVGLKRTVNLGNYESVALEFSAVVDLRDETGADGLPGLDAAATPDMERFENVVQTAFNDAARQMRDARRRFLKSDEDAVTIEQRIGGTPVATGRG